MNLLQRFRTPYMAGFLSIIILAISCSQFDEINDNSEIDNLSGRDIFQGVYFATGTVAELMPSISNSYSYYAVNEQPNYEFESFSGNMNIILDKIAEKHPNYYQNFKSAIQSRDHLTIRQELAKGSEILFETSVETFLDQNEQNILNNIAENIDIKPYLNSDGSIDRKALESDIMKDLNILENSRGTCIFAGIVFVAAAYVLVVHAAGAMTYVAAAWVAYAYAAVAEGTVVTSDEGSGGDGGCEKICPIEQQFALMVDDLTKL